MVMAVTTGICFVGPFLVILPLLVRDSYGGGALEMGILSGMFPLGAVLGGAVIVWRGGLEGHGRALALGQITAATAIAAIGLGLPFSGSVIAVLCWGVSGALFINAGRTLFQQHASQANRARVLSVYTLGILGGAPLGSLLSGFLADRIGLHATLLLAAAVVFTVTLTVVSFMRLLRLR
jgi:MFS family permease